MNMKHCMAMAVCVALARYLYAGSFFPLPSTNAIVLNFDNEIPEAVRETIRLDFDRCLIPSVSEIELYHSDRDPTNRLSLAGLWQPFGCLAATSRLGPKFRIRGTISNDTFTIDVSYAFATNYQHHIETTAAYSNEIAAAYTFIESLSPTNLQTMSTTELLSMDLWKEVPPGQHPSHDLDMSNRLKTRFFPPPRLGFFVWDCGPSNNPPYLWCHVPAVDNIGQRTIVSFDMMIFYQNRWWFSAWPLLEGEQQW